MALTGFLNTMATLSNTVARGNHRGSWRFEMTFWSTRCWVATISDSGQLLSRLLYNWEGTTKHLSSTWCMAFHHSVSEVSVCDGTVLTIAFIFSYVVVVLNGTKNPHWNAVAYDIKNAILRTWAEKGVPATYWRQAEQERRLEEAYQKWSHHGGVWSVAAAKVHGWIVHCKCGGSLHTIINFVMSGTCWSTCTCEKRMSHTSE